MPVLKKYDQMNLSEKLNDAENENCAVSGKNNVLIKSPTKLKKNFKNTKKTFYNQKCEIEVQSASKKMGNGD